ncbi:MAG: lipoate--protein ligase family protein [Bacteroidota bacterium]
MADISDRQWRCIESGFCTGAENMEIDIALAQRLQRGEIPATLRLYGWKPWAVSLGYNQSEQDINRNKCFEYGIDIVRRPTGGRAVLHANELTYSIVMPADGKGITEIYSLISKALVAGLSKICPDIAYETSQPNLQAFYKKQESIPCFSASARYEVQINGKKLVGSAQRRFTAENLPEVVLQHGSILLGTEHRLLAEILHVENNSVKEKIFSDIDSKTIDLSTALQRTVSFQEASSVVRAGFEEAMNIHYEKTIEAVL